MKKGILCVFFVSLLFLGCKNDGKGNVNDNSSPPSVSNISLSPTSLPVPKEGEEFIQALSFDFIDPDGDIDRLEIAVNFPDGSITTRSHQFSDPVAEGTHQESYPVDASYAAGTYRVDVEAYDKQGNRSNVGTAPFTLSETTERLLEIASITPSAGDPGDVVVIEGRGFFTGDPTENKIQFKRLARANILSVRADQMEVVVPVGALTGPIVLETAAGRTMSQAPFTVNPRLTILPAVHRLLTGKALDFMIAQSGMRSTDLSCTVNGQTEPDPSLGTLVLNPAGFTYTAPQDLPAVNPVLIRCAAEDVPGIYADLGIEISTPPPSPGATIVSAAYGGTIDSLQGDVQISVPAGALLSDTLITVESLNLDALDISSVDAYTHAAIRLGPSGLQFAQPVAISFALKNWREPGTHIPLFLFDEVTKNLEDTGRTAVVGTSGLKATGAVEHFSVIAAREPLSAAQVVRRQAVKDLVTTNPFILPEFEVTLSPEMPLFEGLSVPVLVRRRDGPLPGMGPFTEVSALSVSVTIEGYPAVDTPASAGPFIHPSPDGWELGTIINLDTLPACGEGATKRGYLNIGYEKVGLSQRMSIPFTVTCLDELIFSGSEPPTGVPPFQGGYIDYKDLRVRRDQNGKYSVEMIYPARIYRFSKVDIGSEGILTYTRYLPITTGVNEPFMMEVTGDVRVAGTIFIAGGSGQPGEEGGPVDCDDCGGGGAQGTFLNAGDGGPGGPWTVEPNDTCLPLPCTDYSCYTVMGLKFSRCKGGHNGQDALLSDSSGGQGGLAWKKINYADFISPVGSFILSAGACVEGALGACLATGEALLDIYGTADGMADNDGKYIKSAGEGGYNSGPNAPLDVAYFNPSVAGGGGGGSGEEKQTVLDEKAGGGGGSGGGGAANLKLVVGGRVTIEPGGMIDGHGGPGGQGGNGEDGEAAPGGGGGGGSGSAVHIIALKGVVNYAIITAPGGRGGRSGEISKNIGPGLTAALVDSSFGRIGYNGRLRVDGPFEGSDPIAMPLYRGPWLMNRFEVSSNGSSSALIFSAGDYAQSYSLIPESFSATGLQPVTATVRNIYNSGGRQYDHTLQLHPWQKAYVFYFPDTADTDGDGLADAMEVAYGSDPNKVDTDGDGLSDGDEVFVHKTHPTSADTDGDRIADGMEIGSGSDPLNAESTPEVCDGFDNDLDGLVDEGFPDTDQDSQADCIDPDDDNDGLSDVREAEFNTNPLLPDTDDDGISDGDEVFEGSDPLNAESTPEVCDGDDNDLDGLIDEGCTTGAVSGGGSHTLSIKTDGTLWAWGGSGIGQVGDGTMEIRCLPVPIGVENDWENVSAGEWHSLGLKTDGTLWGWGYNEQGQLGLGDTDDLMQLFPVQIGDENAWTVISAGYTHSFGLKSDGTLWAWGANDFGQLGDGTLVDRNSPVPIGDNNWRMVSAKYHHTLGLKKNGTLWAWGFNDIGTLGDGSTTQSLSPIQIGDDTNWEMILTGFYHNLAIKSDGTLWAWGANDHGMLGDETTDPAHVPIQIGFDSDWVMVAAGSFHSLAVKSNGTLWAWGDDIFGQLGNGTMTGDIRVPSQTGTDADWVTVSAGHQHSLALKSDGTLWAWGINSLCELGDGTRDDGYAPILITW